LLLITIFPVLKIYSSGTTEVSADYLDLGKLYITNERATYELPLDYWKPDGIKRINTLDLRGIRIHKMIIDGNPANPVHGFFDFNDEFRFDQSKEVNSIGSYYTIIMRLRMIPANQLEKMIYPKAASEVAIKKIGTGLFYETWAEKDTYLRLYWIPWGTKEVYINYSIFVPKFGNILKYDIIETNKTIRFELEWQE
jgi:hypothetical protein